MIIETTISLTTLLSWSKVIGSIMGIFSLFFGVFKVINWVKNKFVSINDNVILLKDTLAENMTGLREDVKAQTHVIATELREQRQDFRTFYGPFVMQIQAQAYNPPPIQPALAKAKKTPVRRKKAKL